MGFQYIDARRPGLDSVSDFASCRARVTDASGMTTCRTNRDVENSGNVNPTPMFPESPILLIKD